MPSRRLDTITAEQLNIPPEQAAALIMAGRIWVGGSPALKPGEAWPADTVVEMREKERRYASRSGEKLEAALDFFGVDPTGLTVCDIGASNGGFTDCLLQRGAAHVVAVDVAYGILDWRLRQSERVTVLERTNARHLTEEQVGGKVDLATADVSFISLVKIFPAINRILRENGTAICLIKPQFEAPQKLLGKNGILKDPAALPAVLKPLFAAAAENDLFICGMIASPIKGRNGNIEYLALFRRESGPSGTDIDGLCEKMAAQIP
ncbi:MAG: TlyA family RNA methyltransferase [Oscillospiraceae bacterium]|nr:TlyA family RNA methyltransferase [Oscillospiraceae bacterium]